MNLSLLDPFTLAQEYPENLSLSLKSGHSTCCRFNNTGEMLASGRADGTVVIFDMETMSLMRILRSHVRQVQSLSWSNCNRYLLSTSSDWKAILWDLETGSRLKVVQFEAPIYGGDFHPQTPFIFVVALYQDSPHLADMTGPGPSRKYTLPTIPKRTPTGVDSEDNEVDDKKAAQDAKMMTTTAIFSRDGKHIITGTNKGWVNFIDVDTKQVVYSSRLSSGIITYMRLTPAGRDMVVNSMDRIVRTVHLPDLSNKDVEPELTVEHKFQDLVNRLLWNHCTFSSTGEYIAASTYHNHDIYIWERTKASLVKILEGPKEELGVVEWHPSKAVVAGVGLETGRVYIWGTSTHQRWSALAPDFTELEENEEYFEKEDEFDIHPKEDLTKRRLHRENEVVDVLNFRPTDNMNRWILPVQADLEDTESEGESTPPPPEPEPKERERKRAQKSVAATTTTRKRKK